MKLELVAKHNTYIKPSTKQSKTISLERLKEFKQGEFLPVESLESVGSHWRLTAYVFKGHVTVKGNPDYERKPERMSEAGLEMLKEFEGLRLRSYQDSGGVWTIGYGHTATARRNMSIDRITAENLLKRDLAQFEKVVRDRVIVPLTQNQFDALVSFAFNVGAGALTKSTLLKRLNKGDYNSAGKEFKRWVHAGGKRLQGLVNRREKEAGLFLAG